MNRDFVRSNSPKIAVCRDPLTPTQESIQFRPGQGKQPDRLERIEGSTKNRLLDGSTQIVFFGSDIRHPPCPLLVRGTQGRLRNPVAVQTFGWDGPSQPYPKDGQIQSFGLFSALQLQVAAIHIKQLVGAAAKSHWLWTLQPHRQQPTRLHCPWDPPGKNTGVGCHFLLQCTKVKSEREVAQSCPTLCNLRDCSLPGSSIHGIFQARVLEWVAIAFSEVASWWSTNLLQGVNSADMCFPAFRFGKGRQQRGTGHIDDWLEQDTEKGNVALDFSSPG